jgi:hypothetical protein
MLPAISDNFDIQRRAILTLIDRIAEKDKIANRNSLDSRKI